MLDNVAAAIQPLGINVSSNPLLPLVFDNEPGYLCCMAKAWQLAMQDVGHRVTSDNFLE